MISSLPTRSEVLTPVQVLASTPLTQTSTTRRVEPGGSARSFHLTLDHLPYGSEPQPPFAPIEVTVSALEPGESESANLGVLYPVLAPTTVSVKTDALLRGFTLNENSS